MGSKAKPGEFDCYAAAEDDEPMFILLGRDEDGPELIEMWCRMRLAHLLASELTAHQLHRGVRKIAEALQCAGNMREWRDRKRTAQPSSGLVHPFPVDPNWSGQAENRKTLADCVSKVEQNFAGIPSPLVERMRTEYSATDRHPMVDQPCVLSGAPGFGIKREPRSEPHPVTECSWRGCGGAREVGWAVGKDNPPRQDRTDPEGGIPGRNERPPELSMRNGHMPSGE